MASLPSWVHATLTPVCAFTALFGGFYALLIATGRSDGVIVASAAAATIACAIGAFVIRKTRPNLTLALVTMPSALLFAVVVLR